MGKIFLNILYYCNLSLDFIVGKEKWFVFLERKGSVKLNDAVFSRNVEKVSC